MTTMTVVIHTTAPQYAEQIQQLTEILVRHKNDKDDLAQDLLGCGIEILRLAKENRSASPEVQARIADQCIQTLAQKFLTCPFFVNDFFKYPVLGADGWTYEKNIYLICCRVFNRLSPFDGSEMKPNPPDHLFAKEMMEIAGLLPKQEEGKGAEEDSAAPADEDPKELAKTRYIYEQLATFAIARRDARRLQRGMGTSLVRTTHTLGQMRLSGATMLKESDSRALALQAKFSLGTELILKNCIAEVAAVKQQMAFSEETHQQKISLLKQQGAANAAQAKIVQAQVDAMNAAHQKDLTALSTRLTSLENTHQQLQSQRDREARAHQSTVSSMQQAHQATIISMATAQKKELEGFEHRTKALEQETQQLKQEKAALQAGQSTLQVRLDNAVQEIRELQDEDDGPSCVIA